MMEMAVTKVIEFLILICCPFLVFGDTGLPRWLGSDVGSSSWSARDEIQAVISREVDDSIRVSMEKKTGERLESSESSNSKTDTASSNVGFIQQVGQ